MPKRPARCWPGACCPVKRTANGSPRVRSALTGLETTLGLVDHIGAPATANHAVVPVTVLERLQRIADLHDRASRILACCGNSKPRLYGGRAGKSSAGMARAEGWACLGRRHSPPPACGRGSGPPARSSHACPTPPHPCHTLRMPLAVLPPGPRGSSDRPCRSNRRHSVSGFYETPEPSEPFAATSRLPPANRRFRLIPPPYGCSPVRNAAHRHALEEWFIERG